MDKKDNEYYIAEEQLDEQSYPIDFSFYSSTFDPELNTLDQATLDSIQQEFRLEDESYGSSSMSFGQPELLLNQDANMLMSTFQPLPSDFQTQNVREEQDVFSELIDLAEADLGKQKLNRFYKPTETQINQKDRWVYDLKIVQQPLRARMCGFGDKDQRPIVPAPILQLFIKDKEGNLIDPNTLDITFLIVLCDPRLQTGEPATSASNTVTRGHSVPVSQVVVFSSSEDIRNPRTSKLKNLVGSSVASANKLYDLEDKLGIFFIFHDVCLRTEGVFRLKFSLVDVGSAHSHKVNTDTLSQVIQTVFSEPFTVYTAKKYPGVVEASPLSVCFSRQGIKIPIRKDPTRSKNKEKLKELDQN